MPPKGLRRDRPRERQAVTRGALQAAPEAACAHAAAGSALPSAHHNARHLAPGTGLPRAGAGRRQPFPARGEHPLALPASASHAGRATGPRAARGDAGKPSRLPPKAGEASAARNCPQPPEGLLRAATETATSRSAPYARSANPVPSPSLWESTGAPGRGGGGSLGMRPHDRGGAGLSHRCVMQPRREGHDSGSAGPSKARPGLRPSPHRPTRACAQRPLLAGPSYVSLRAARTCAHRRPRRVQEKKGSNRQRADPPPLIGDWPRRLPLARACRLSIGRGRCPSGQRGGPRSAPLRPP